MWDTYSTLYLGVAFTIAGLSVVVNELVELAFAADSLEWPIVQGEVEETGVMSSLSDKSVVYAPLVRYHYRVGDDQYFSDRIGFGGVVSTSFRSLATSAADRYRAKKTLQVRVSPKDPRISVLEPGWHWSFVPIFAAGALFFGLGVRYLLTYVGVLGS